MWRIGEEEGGVALHDAIFKYPNTIGNVTTP